jgi:putative dehydrogenase
VTEPVAFVGLGAMGLPMATCLVRAGFTVRGFDIQPRAVRALEEAGGHASTSAADAAQGARIAVVVVLNADQVEEVAFGEQGFVQRLEPDSVVVAMSTMSPQRTRALGAQAAARGLRWVDAPISGGTARAVDGTLTTMVGAEPADLERVRAVLEAFSKHVFHLGPVGAGATAKMVNQMLVYSNLAATVEAIALCRKSGADPSAVYEVICTAMGASAIFESRVPKLIDGSYASGGSMRIALKDLGIIEDTARDLGVPTFMTAQATQLFRAAAAAGLLDEDDLAVARVVDRLAGL